MAQVQNGVADRPAPDIDTTDIAQLEAGRRLLVRYLGEAHATEGALVTTLRAHIQMTPKGSYRSLLERHLEETRAQVEALARRMEELGAGRSIVAVTLSFAETVAGQALALTKGPIDLVRGAGGEEKLLKNAKDECATEALEIATYLALETLADAVGDRPTSELAKRHREQEERMLEDLHRHLPALTHATVLAQAGGQPTYDVSETGAAENVRRVRDKVSDQVDEVREDVAGVVDDAVDATRDAAGEAADTAREAAGAAKRATRSGGRQARKVPGEKAVEGGIRGAVADADDLPIEGYVTLTTGQITPRLNPLTQVELRTIDGFERRNKHRSSVLERIEALKGDEPFAGFDDLGEEAVVSRLPELDHETITRVRAYEQQHRRRVDVLAATQRQLSAR